MHVSRFMKDEDKWVVGYFEPSGDWHPCAYFDTDSEAVKAVNYLNGGLGIEPEALERVLMAVWKENA